jgi:hypothetical protein
MTAEEQEKQAKDSEAKAKKRLDDERKRLADERQEHVATLAAEAEKSKSELDEVLEKLTAPERKHVRLQAYLHILKSDWDMPNQLQTHVDNVALRLARYMADGKV